jgi:hypothetical protein
LCSVIWTRELAQKSVAELRALGLMICWVRVATQ